jgi:hypothetical protein
MNPSANKLLDSSKNAIIENILLNIISPLFCHPELASGFIPKWILNLLFCRQAGSA